MGIENSKIFQNVDNINAVLECLNATYKNYKKSEIIIRENEEVLKIGIVLEGEVLVFRSLLNDEVTEVQKILPLETFGELNIYTNKKRSEYLLIANKDTKILFLDGEKLINETSIGCKYRTQMNLNMLKHLAQVNSKYQNQIEIRSVSSLRDRILLYLKGQARGRKYFDITHNREQMAKYIGATRPAVSKILIDLKNEGLIDYHKNTFTLKGVV